MSVMIQIRNVPDHLHRVLKSRAALEGRSLSDYLLTTITDFAECPTLAEMRAGLDGRELRGNLSAYDAAYVALAEALVAPRVTRDRRLAAAPGHRARIELL